MELVHAVLFQRFLLRLLLVGVRRPRQFERVDVMHQLVEHFVTRGQTTQHNGGFDGIHLFLISSLL